MKASGWIRWGMGFVVAVALLCTVGCATPVRSAAKVPIHAAKASAKATLKGAKVAAGAVAGAAGVAVGRDNDDDKRMDKKNIRK
jgi:hypothetical protein